jgi:hypothetical protein
MRHPNHDKIVDALVQNALPLKTIAKKFGSTLNAVKAMRARYVIERRERRDIPPEGQLHFFNRLRIK